MLTLLPFVTAALLDESVVQSIFLRAVAAGSTELVAQIRPLVRSHTVFSILGTRCLLADDIPGASKWFKEASELAKKNNNRFPVRFSLRSSSTTDPDPFSP